VPVKVSVSDPLSFWAAEVRFGFTYSTRSTWAVDCDPPEAVSASLWPLAPFVVGKLSGVDAIPLDVTPTAPDEGTASTAPEGSIQYDDVSHPERSAGLDYEAQAGTAPLSVSLT